MRDVLQLLMKELTEAMGLHGLEAGQDGSYALLFDRQWVVHIASDPATGCIHLLASFSLLPGALPAGLPLSPPCHSGQGARPGRARHGVETRLHPGSGLLLLYASADPADLDAVDFCLWLQAFVDGVEHWTLMLNACRSQDEDPLAGPLPKGIS